MGGTDWFEIVVEASGNSIATFGLLVSIVSGYLVVAYLVGTKLSRPQAIIINTLFIASTVSVTVGHWQYTFDSIVAREQASLALPTVLAPVAPGSAIIVSSALALIDLGVVCAALLFMWSVRHSRDPAAGARTAPVA